MVQNFSYKNEFDFFEKGPVGTHFHRNRSARKLFFTQRQRQLENGHGTVHELIVPLTHSTIETI